MKWIAGTLAVVMSLVFFACVGSVIYQGIIFDIRCQDRMKRAGDANTVELAIKEMEVVVSYAEKEGLTKGYTSIIYLSPDEDVEFWYTNLKASVQELKAIKPDASQLEKSNILMKLRETLLDEGKSTSVTCPQGISLFPHNTAYAIWGWISFLLAIIFWIWFFIALDRD